MEYIVEYTIVSPTGEEVYGSQQGEFESEQEAEEYISNWLDTLYAADDGWFIHELHAYASTR